MKAKFIEILFLVCIVGGIGLAVPSALAGAWDVAAMAASLSAYMLYLVFRGELGARRPSLGWPDLVAPPWRAVGAAAVAVLLLTGLGAISDGWRTSLVLSSTGFGLIVIWVLFRMVRESRG